MKLFLRYLFYFIVFLSSLSIDAQTYQLQGNPVNTTGWDIVPSAIVNGDFIQLTADQTSKVGGIKLNAPINLKYCEKWKIEFDFRIDGNGTSTYGRGDGLAFWYLANPPSSYTSGAGLGIPANSTGLMVGFDIFNNSTEAQMSKVHILYGVNNTGGNNIEYNNTAGSTFHSPDLISTIPFVSSNYRHVVVNVETDPANPNNWIIKLSIDGTQIVNQSFAPSGAAAAMTQGYFGFSASTGGASARHSVKNVKIYVDKVPLLQNAISPSALCPDPNTGIVSTDLTSYNAQLVTTPANYNFTYYVQGSSTPIANPVNFQFSTNTTISVVIKDPGGSFCDNMDAKINLVPVIVPKSDVTLTACQFNNIATYDLTSAAVTSLAAATKKYYPTLVDLNAGTSEILNPTSYTSSPGFVYVKITSPEGCVVIAKITLDVFPVPIVTDGTLSACADINNPSTGLFDLTLANVSTGTVIKKYYPTYNDTVNGTNEITAPDSYTSGNSVVFVKVFDSNNCFAIAKITLTLLLPKYSDVLKDQVVCAEYTAVLDAGSGFTAYEWSTGASTQSIDAYTGEYWVILTSTDNCKVKQFVKVLSSALPVIQDIIIDNDKATVIATGGTPPYQYSIDNIHWQNSNVFSGLPRGENTFYVKDSFDCAPVQATVTVPNFINVITPNGDGYNDIIDYSALSYKQDFEFSVYDRYGTQIFKGSKMNNYIWNGFHQGKKLSTGTYWYSVTWSEPNNLKMKYNHWVVLKNRE